MANYNNGVYSVTQSASYSTSQNYLTDVGAFGINSASYYGTFDQGGNASEWVDAGTSDAGERGSYWDFDDSAMRRVGVRTVRIPSGESHTRGFRIASVAATATVTASTTTLALGTTTAGTASAPVQSFTVGGSNLTANLIVTAPSGVELSKDSGSTWQTSEILTPSSGTVSTSTIQARIAASATAGSISGVNITCASSGATTQNVSVSGTVLTIGSQGLCDIGAASATTGESDAGKRKPADLNTAAIITIGNLITTGSQTGYFSGLSTRILGPIDFNATSPTGFTFGDSTMGSFSSTSIVETQNTSGARSFYVLGTYTAGTFNPGLTPAPAPASFLISFTQSPTGNGAISASATLSIPPTPTPPAAPAATPPSPTPPTPGISNGSQGLSDIGAASATTGETNPGNRKPADLNTAAIITIGNLITTGSQTGYFSGLSTRILGPIDFNATSPTGFTFGDSTMGSFSSTSIVETQNTSGARSFYVLGTYTAGTFNPSLTPTPAPASLLISFTQSPAVGGAISASATLSIPPSGAFVEMVNVGNAGNLADTTGYGAVSYAYKIGKYEITLAQYAAFLNAVAKTDTYGLYNTSMATDLNVAGITRSGSSGSYTYTVLGSGNRPVAYVSWFEAARFTNWLANGQPTGAQGNTTTEDGTYTLNGATSGVSFTKNATNPNTSAAPTYWIPSEDEWYKAAYYDPTPGAGGGDNYWTYPTQSNTAPGNVVGAGANQANYKAGSLYSVTQNATLDPNQNYLTDGGVYSNSASYYGTYDQGGGVYEWSDGVVSTTRIRRGGSWSSSSSTLNAGTRGGVDPATESASIGFRVASVAPAATVSVTVPGGTTALTATNSGTAGASVNFSISGANLTGAPGDLTVTAPTNVQVSADNSAWVSSASIHYTSATLTSTPVYVRLAGTGTVGTISGNVSISGGGLSAAVTQAVSGTLNAPPASVTVPGGTTTLTATTSGAAGASVSFNITGANLTGGSGNLTVTAPTNVQVSANNSTWGGTASIPFTSATLTSTPVYVRLSGTGTVGTISGNVSISGGGLSAAVTQAVSGTLNVAGNLAVTTAIVPTPLAVGTIPASTFPAGDTGSVTVNLNNTVAGSAPAGVTSLTVTLPPLFTIGTLATPQNGFTLSKVGQVVTISGGTVTNGTPVSLSIPVSTASNLANGTVLAIPAPVLVTSNGVTQSSPTGATVTSNLRSDFSISFGSTTSSIVIGNKRTTTVTLTNNGPSDAPSVVSWAMPINSNVTISNLAQGVVPGAGGTVLNTALSATTSVNASFGAFASGGTAVVTFDENVASNKTPASFNDVATVDLSLSANTVDPNTNNGSASLGTTLVSPPTVTASTSSLALGTTTAGTASTPAQSFTVGGSNLTANLIVTAPTGVELSKDSGSTWQTSETLTPSSGTVGTSTIQARITASASLGAVTGNITCASSGATTQNVSVSGTVNTAALGYVRYGTSGSAYTQNCDTLPFTSGSAINAASPVTLGGAGGNPITATAFTVPGTANSAFSLSDTTLGAGGFAIASGMDGWYGFATVANKLGAHEGSQTTGGLISFGGLTSSNRAIGLSGTSSTGATALAVCIKNTTGAVLNQISLAFTGELWRQQTSAKTLDFSYFVDTTNASPVFPVSGTTAVSSLQTSFQTGTAAAVDGTQVSNQLARSATNLSVGTWGANQYLWLVWSINGPTGGATGSSQELAIDNISFSASPLPHVAPVVAAFGPTVSYAANGQTLPLAGNATVTSTATNFNTGNLTVSITSGKVNLEDVLSVANIGTASGQIGVSGSNITYGGTTIGTLSGGAGGTALVVTLNSNATPAATQALLQNVTYKNLGSPATLSARTVQVTIDDGSGFGSLSVSAPVSLTLSLANGPLLNNDSYSAYANTALTVTAANGVFKNDNGSGQPLQILVNSTPAHGTLSLNAADGSFTYTPTNGYTGSDSFTYTASNAVQLWKTNLPSLGTFGGVTVTGGGYGSSLTAVPGSATGDEYYGLTDRGPNVGGPGGIKIEPIPNFTPSIGKFKMLPDGTAQLEATITLKTPVGTPYSGHVNSAASTGETITDLNGNVIPPDSTGYDPEGLVALTDGTFWISDEYGPFITHFDATGKQIGRLSPYDGSLPKELAVRVPNKGMEGLTVTPDGTMLVGIMQNALQQPDLVGSAAADPTKIVMNRIVTYTFATGAVHEYIYLMEGSNGVSEITAVTNTTFVVDERDGKFAPNSTKKLFTIDISGASDVGPVSSLIGTSNFTYSATTAGGGFLVGGKSLEFIMAPTGTPLTKAQATTALTTAGLTIVNKTATPALDLIGLLTTLDPQGRFFSHDKVEGVTVLNNGHKLLISNDSDFGITDSTSTAAPYALTQKVSPVTGAIDDGEFLMVNLDQLPTAPVTATVTITVNPLPSLFTVTGGGSYDAGGSGVHVGLSGSETGVNYQLFNGVTSVGSPLAGTGSALDFGLQTAAGTYTVVATNPTTAATRTMTGSALVTINPVADLAITNTDGKTSVVPGTNDTFTITVKNNGPSTVTSVKLNDTPTGLLNPVFTPSIGSYNSTSGVWSGLNLASGQTITMSLSGTVDPTLTSSGTFSNAATVLAPSGVTQTVLTDNSAAHSDTITPQVDLAITNTDGKTSVVPGTNDTFTITVKNNGPSTVTSVKLNDTPTGLLNPVFTPSIGSYNSTSGVWSGLNLASGQTITMSLSGTVDPTLTSSGTFSNAATVLAPSGVTQTVFTDNSATDTDTITPQSDLAITVTDGITTATPGGSVTYTITASNTGPSNAVGATVADTFPASLSNITWTAVGAGGGTATASGSGNINDTVNLPVGGSVTYTVSATISPSATGSLINTVTVAAPSGVTDLTPSNNSATDTDTLAAQADLAISVTDGITTASPGGSTTYTITVSNAGPSNVTGATVADTFPASLTATWTAVGAGGGTATASGTGNINDTVNVPAGGSVTYTVSAAISANATGTLSNTATVAAPNGVTDTNPGNNSATDTDNLLTLVTISATDATAAYTGGNTGTYTFTRTGTSGALTANFTLNSGSTAGTSDYSLSGTGITYAAGTGTVSFPNGQATVTATLAAIAATPAGIAQAGGTVRLDVASGTGYVVGTPSNATVTIAPNGFLVTNTNDSGVGSLRQAVLNANALGGSPTITFDTGVTGTITLTSGSMTISSALTIQGPGANVLAVNGGGTDRIFFVIGNSSKTIRGLTLTNGHAVGGDNNGGGGAIFHAGGGPMSNASLTLDSCAITRSTADTFGGGILNFETLIVLNSTISGNTANGGATGGGGIDSVGDLTMKNSTLSGNSAPNATSGGGGLFSGAPAQITNSTITNNQASFVAGGIAVGNFAVTVGNSIIAANQNNATLPDVGGGTTSFTSQGHNLIGNKGTVTSFTNGVNGDIVGSSSSPIDAKLGLLANNGGPTQTHTLQYSSLAINAGDNTLATNAGLTNDQRGTGFPRVQGTVDIGAFEALLYIPAVTNATTDEDTQTNSGLVITANASDGGGTTNYKITNIVGGTLYKNDGTTAISAGSFITKAEGLAGLKFTPSANSFTAGGFDVQASVSAADAGLRDLIITATITVNPVADTPSVTNASATTGTQTTSGLVISRNAVDSTEIGFFKITNITHGTLFKSNGTTVINAGDFITFAEGNAGLKFTSTNGFSGQAAFDVAGSVDNAGTGLGPVATATINVGTANPTPAQIGITGVFNRQNALYELTANVTNTTAFDINGFRLFVDYTSYLGAFPSLKLQNASSYSPVYVDYPYPVKVGATVPVRLSFYTSNRTFPNPFSPVLNVTTLSTSQTAQPNAPGVQVDRVLALNPGPNQTILLEFPSVVGHWYRISYSSNDMSHWFYSAIPVQATGSRTQWIDTGAPLTDSPPAPPNVTSRFYKVSEIVTP